MPPYAYPVDRCRRRAVRRKRTVWVYPPTEEHRENWEKLAKKAGLSLSRWMLSVVEEHVRGAEDDKFSAKADLWKENVELREANQRLLDERKLAQANRREARGRGASVPRGAVPQRAGGPARATISPQATTTEPPKRRNLPSSGSSSLTRKGWRALARVRIYAE